MNEQERLRAEFDAEFLNDMQAAAAQNEKRSKKTKTAAVRPSDKSHNAANDDSEKDAESDLADLAPFTRAVVETIRTIPAGRIMSYGQVAAAAGSPRGARQVVRILHSMSRKYGLPWHRVVNIRGEIALDEHGGGGEQQEKLEAEGVEFGLSGRIDLNRYRHEADSQM
ncbi:MGMT family protein [Saccharibacillus sacchari]|uniref:MGMT family protein n=1 Tax=Saccharibacillus sacchari TaxID=456493 RepID=A0ACC6P7X5_9BACL